MDLEIVIPDEARLRYIERRKADVEVLRSALGKRTFEDFKRIGHQLKGNAATFGYSDLEKVAIQLEVAGDQQDLVEANRQFGLFEKWVCKVSASL
jgi:HPt (histidine-containing phosphotransfer) domain-containing protein